MPHALSHYCTAPVSCCTLLRSTRCGQACRRGRVQRGRARRTDLTGCLVAFCSLSLFSRALLVPVRAPLLVEAAAVRVQYEYEYCTSSSSCCPLILAVIQGQSRVPGYGTVLTEMKRTNPKYWYDPGSLAGRHPSSPSAPSLTVISHHHYWLVR